MVKHSDSALYPDSSLQSDNDKNSMHILTRSLSWGGGALCILYCFLKSACVNLLRQLVLILIKLLPPCIG